MTTDIETKTVAQGNGTNGLMGLLDGEWVGISVAGEDELLEGIDEVRIGERIEIGSEAATVLFVDEATNTIQVRRS